jgi:hypothetical protein
MGRIRRSVDLLDAGLRLFAPAMHGAKPSGWLGLAYHLLHEISELQPWFQAITESTTIVRQLASDSEKLVRLRRRTEALARTTKYRALIANIVYGENEHIVERDKYDLDEIELPVNGKNHRSVCKPDEGYRGPLHFVMTGRLQLVG